MHSIGRLKLDPGGTPDSTAGSADRPIHVICEHWLSDVDQNMLETYKDANRLRSETGYSIDPTPAAAWPFKGKKPCSPMIAAEYEH